MNTHANRPPRWLPPWREDAPARPGEMAPDQILAEVARLRRPGYLERRAGRATLPGIPAGLLVVKGHGDSSVGYGRMLAHVMKGLEAAGQRTAFAPLEIEESRVPLDPFLRDRRRDNLRDAPGLRISSAGEAVPGSALWTMWESSRLPDRQVASCNTARVVIVPCRWCADVFRESGVTAPIRVVPLGVDGEAYFSRPHYEGFTALSVARVAHGGARKGVEELIAAFLEALEGRPYARLHLKLWPDCDVKDPGHDQVVINRRSHDDIGMRHLYASCNVYASMTKGEGWGMPIHEAMSCGRAYVGPVHTGIADFVTPECSYPVEWDPAPGGGVHYTGHGDWYVPRHESMVRQLRAAYDDPEGVRRKGEAARLRAAEFPWERSGRELLAVLREFGLVGHSAVPTPGLAREIELTKRRRACPHGSKPEGCGCSGELDCSKLGRRVFRAECFSCLEESDRMKDVASVGDDVYVGPLEACDRLAGDGFRVIHLWSELNRSEGHLCQAVAGGNAVLSVRWTEGQPLGMLSIPVDEIAAFAKQPGKLLVHCRAGSCRSTAIGLLVKLARGREPFEAIADIGRGMYRDRHLFPGWTQGNVVEILDWATARRITTPPTPSPAAVGP